MDNISEQDSPDPRAWEVCLEGQLREQWFYSVSFIAMF